MSKRYLYDANDELQGVFDDENALHRYLNQEYTSEPEDRGPSGRVLTNKTILPSVFKIERRLIHKRKEAAWCDHQNIQRFATFVVDVCNEWATH